jgi:AraC-like DNA-binding protein
MAGGEPERISPGRANFWFFPEGIDARGEVTGKGAYDCAGVFVDPEFLSPGVREVLAAPISGFSSDAMGRAFDGLVQELTEPDDEVLPLFTDGWAMQALAYVTRAATQIAPRRPAVRSGLAPWQLRRAQEMLRADLSANVPLQSVASVCKLSVSHFARAFKISTGHAPHQWLIGERVDAARSLLAQSSMALVEVADACGFADQSHFSRVFARTMGASPGAWRRENRI